MREVILVHMHRAIDQQGQALQEVVLPSLMGLTTASQQDRVAAVAMEVRIAHVEAFLAMGFWARLRWMLCGTVVVPADVIAAQEAEFAAMRLTGTTRTRWDRGHKQETSALETGDWRVASLADVGTLRDTDAMH